MLTGKAWPEMSDDRDAMFLHPLYGNDPVTAEDHREQSIEMLREASRHGHETDRVGLYLAAAQVHATLALTAPREPSGPEPC